MREQGRMQTVKQRVGWIDIAKGIAILFVIWGHAMRDPMRTESAALDYSYRVISAFHMGLFFWLSGFVYQLNRREPTLPEVRRFVQKKLKTQLLPWFVYSMFCYAAFAVALRIPALARVLASAGYEGSVSLLFFLRRCLQGDNIYAFHLWFIYTLFLISDLVETAGYIAVRIGQSTAAAERVLFALALLGDVLLPLNILPLGDWKGLFRYSCLYLPFYLFGMWMKDLQLPRACRIIWGGAGLAYVLIRAARFSAFSGDVIQAPTPALELLLRGLAYLLLPGMFLLFGDLCRWLDAKHMAFLGELGRASFYIYLLHQPFCCAFLGNALYIKLKLPALVTILICFAASIAVPMAFERIAVQRLHRCKGV